MRNVTGVCVILSMAGAAIGEDPTRIGLPASPRVLVEGPVVEAARPDGVVLAMPTQTVWKPACSNPGVISYEHLAAVSITHEAMLGDGGPVTIVDRGHAGDAGLDLVFVLDGSVPAAAVGAFATAEAYLEGQFPTDTMTVTVTVSFAPLGSLVIGGTSSSYGSATWADSRAVLVSGMDGNDTIQSSLPSGTTIPVRYSASKTTNETRVFWTFANWKANGGAVAGNDASMQYSTQFPFDFDPSNGVTAGTISLQDVIVHETGHALGFVSGVDFRFQDIEALDIFRFQRTDGNKDYNPDTTGEFQTKARLARYNAPNDDHNFDSIAVEYRLSDGSPNQASHFREQAPAIGIMDPTFSYGETFYPNFLRTPDLTIFDALGYDG